MDVPPTILALFLAVMLAAVASLLAGRRGGRFRGLPGWIGFWVFFAILLVCLSRASRWVSFPLLALLMFAALKQYFFLVPLRPQDRWAILVAYASIPIALWPAILGSYELFLGAVALSLFLLAPVVLAMGARQSGFMDASGRVLVGLLIFVFCAAHLGLMARLPEARLELFGVVALLGEVPQRLAGRVRPGGEFLRPALGVVIGMVLAGVLGAWLGPVVEIGAGHGAAAGIAVAVVIGAGATLADAVAEELAVGASSSRVGRGAFLDRTMPALYAAPVFYLYLRTFL